MAGISTPFAQSFTAVESTTTSPPFTSNRAAPSTQFSGPMDDSIESLLPPSASLDNFLSGATPGLDSRRGSGLPNLLLTFSNMKSLGSLDLSWLAEAPIPGTGSGSVETQRQASAAEMILGTPNSHMPSSSDLPAVPALRLDGSVPPGMVANSDAIDAAHVALADAQANLWRAMNSQPMGAGASWLPSTRASFPQTEATPAQQQHAAMQQAYYAAIMGVPVSSPFFMNNAAPDPTLSSAPLSGLSSSTFSSTSSLGTAPFVPVNGMLPVTSLANSRADAMAQWAQEKALMAALSSSDMAAAVQAMSGACGVPQGGTNSLNMCPFQVQICNRPAVCVAQTQPVKVSCLGSPSSPGARELP